MQRSSKISNKFYAEIANKTGHIDASISKQTNRYLNRLAKLEMKLSRKISNSDSLIARNIFGEASEKYKYFSEQMLKADSFQKNLSGAYFPYIDSLKSSLTFLKISGTANPEGFINNRLQESLNAFNQLQSRFEISQEIEQYISQRKEQIRQLVNKYSNLASYKKYIDRYSKEVYYYRQQIAEYKDVLNDPGKYEKKVLAILNKIPVYRSFVKQHAMLACLFRLGAADDVLSDKTETVIGMPTRDDVVGALKVQSGLQDQKLTSLLQSNLQSGQGLADKLKMKLNGFGNKGGDLQMPNFKLNNQRGKSFLRRLEYGSNLQTTHGSLYFPTTTDVALTLGYKLNSKRSAGIGVSYKVGWGNNIRNIKVSSQGAGFRSYFDLKIKNSIFATGGLEYNYQQPFASVEEIKEIKAWQQSGLLGVSKVLSLKNRMLKNSKIQLL
jgi:hypothetical protein